MALEKVWVVTYHTWDTVEIRGVFDSPDLADTFVNDQNDAGKFNNYEITEATINQEVE